MPVGLPDQMPLEDRVMLDLMDRGEARPSLVGASGWAPGALAAPRVRASVGHRRLLCGAVHRPRTPTQAEARCSEAESLPMTYEAWWIEATPQEAGARLSRCRSASLRRSRTQARVRLGRFSRNSPGDG